MEHEERWTHAIGAIPGLDVARAKRYSRVRLASLLAGLVWSGARAAWFAGSGKSATWRDRARAISPDRRLATPAYLATTMSFNWLTSLPLAYLTGHLVERHFGLTKQTHRGWVTDAGKGFALSLALEVPAATVAYAVIRRRPNDWWLLLSAATVPLGVVFSHLAPVIIMPLFNRFEPIQDDALVARIQLLADRSGVHVADVLRMDMSRQTEKANAFFTGIGTTKRIVLGDTLLDRYTPAEVEAVVAHELGHQVHGDIWRLIGLGAGLGFGGAYALHHLAPRVLRRTTSRTGVRHLGDEAGMPVVGLLMLVFGLIALPIQNAVSRAIERRTDRFAMSLTGDGPAYSAAMTRLASQNLADPDPSPLVVFFLYSHPPIAERIAAAARFGQRNDCSPIPIEA